MDKLRALQFFVRLADLGSFTRVAEQTNVTKSMISKEISKLEESLGARLLHRSTRNIELTHVGQGYLQRARAILAQLDDADSFVQDLQQHAKGKLKINAPMALGLTDLSVVFADFMEAYPDIHLDIHLGDENTDLVEQGFDLGFRASSRPFDSQYVGRPLTRFEYRICAAPSYIERHTAITKAADLSQHNCFVYSYFQGKNLWPIGEGVTIEGKLRANSTIFMMEAIKRGQGIGFIPEFVCREAIDKGEVVEILAGETKPNLTLYALYPARRYVPPALTHCIQFLEKWFER
ncbi:LysR family transcriptional regulator [Hahella sp. KA22]|uniref:LysR family transcriptional regulator n=1 Tax=Hahella sp. KA22 TaxID=1628392 RepID=UPI000FDD787B|nr:LysR family transcriptional regulator [Hahella sp. KA22]AZZ90646.1 LysR family transcriptional regulator [Hahella sp. KA22]QAY54017.1 LysR family transcriptional regulator [Hahella sp. KA22]